MGEEDGNGPRGVVAMAVFAGDRRIGILDRAKDIETGFAVHTNVFVERHNIILNPESNRVNGRLYPFGGYFNNVKDWKVGRVEGWKIGRMEDGRLQNAGCRMQIANWILRLAAGAFSSPGQEISAIKGRLKVCFYLVLFWAEFGRNQWM
jgi:hypothetical protein